MGKVVCGMTISLDGFVNDRAGSVGALYPDFDTLVDTEPMRESIRDTGAVVMGWNTYAMAGDPDEYAESYEYQAAIFVLTHEIPAKRPKENDQLTFTFVTDGIESALKQAKAAAGDRDVVVVGGPSTIQQCIKTGLIDELHIDIMPVLLGGGLRLFDDLEPLQLERLSVIALPAGRTTLKFRIVK